MTTVTISCCRCGKKQPFKLKKATDVIYVDGMAKEIGWKKSKYGGWFCPTCLYGADYDYF